MSERVILKLGGSVITDKSADCAINQATSSRRLQRLLPAAKTGGIIIVHGAGSCGHPEAKRYHLDTGVSAGETEGIYVTNRVVSGLNDAVVAGAAGKGCCRGRSPPAPHGSCG